MNEQKEKESEISKDCDASLVQNNESEKEIISETNLQNESSERTSTPDNNAKEKILSLEQELSQMRMLMLQKDEVVALYNREKQILEKEKLALKRELDIAIKEKENAVMIYATKEKSVLDVRKEKENVEKQLNDTKKEIKIITTKYQLLNEEKGRLSGILDEKCNEIKKLQKENEKFKTDLGNLEMKTKWISIKLTQETDNKNAIEKRLNEVLQEKNIQSTEEKLTEQQKMEQEANVILLKHENEKREKQLESLEKEYKQTLAKYKEIQEELQRDQEEKAAISLELEKEKSQHIIVQNSLSQELLNSAKLRSQLEDLRILQAQDVINKEEIASLINSKQDLEQRLEDYKSDLRQLRNKESELLSINKEMTEKVVELQNEIFLQTSKLKAIAAENDILKREKLKFDTKYNEISSKLDEELNSKNEERALFTKHLSEKTKLYEATKKKLDTALGDLEAVKNKHSQIVKELNRELGKYKKHSDNELQRKHNSDQNLAQHSPDGVNVRRQSDSEPELISQNSLSLQEPSTKHLVDRILRLQQAATRQTEKLIFSRIIQCPWCLNCKRNQNSFSII